MELTLSEEHVLIRDTARDFARKVLAPNAGKRDQTKEFPVSELKQLAEMSLLGVNVPDIYGGAEAGTLAYSLVMQELARGDASVSVAVGVTNMVGELIASQGTEEQKKEHLPKLMDGTYVCGSFALSEPQAGSDPAGLRTAARKTSDGWELTGTKQWITSGDHAGIMVVWAVTDKEAGHKGLTAFLVRGDTPGISVSKAEHKMGLNGSSTVQLAFDQVAVGEGDVLGGLGQGFRLAMIALDGGRIGIGSQALGIGRFALDEATRYALERTQFGKPIFYHQAVGNMLADCATWLDAAELLTLRAAWKKDQGLPFSQEASMAKVFSSEHACKVCDHALQIHGGYGYTHDFPVERAYRDVRVTRIYEGTSEIQRIVIAKNLMRSLAG